MDETKLLQIINESRICKAGDYVSYFFHEIVGIHTDLYYDKLDNEPFYLSIIKDSITRVTANDHRGVLMERAWRNCLFFFIDRKTYAAHFDLHNGKFPRTNDIVAIERTIFEKIKREHSSWFVRSYVYITLVLCDEEIPISKADFHIFYWNTNYKFREVSSKTLIFNNVTYSIFAKNVRHELAVIEASNHDVLECVEAYLGSLEYRGDAQERYEDIELDIRSGTEFILVEGPARSGKTIIAMRLLHAFRESKLLIMNWYFYRAIKDAFSIVGVEFPANRIYHHDLRQPLGCWVIDKKKKTIGMDLSFVIVDECQRLSKLDPIVGTYGQSYQGLDELETIIHASNHKCTVFLGDDMQRLGPNDNRGTKAVKDSLMGRSFRAYSFEQTIGIPESELLNIKYLLGEEGAEPVERGDFDLTLHHDFDDLYGAFLRDTSSKKHIVSLGFSWSRNICFSTSNGISISEIPETFEKANFEFLYNEEIAPRYFLSPYQVISREIEQVYLAIPEQVQSQSGVLSTGGLVNDEFLIRQLYTLMTRATLGLHIFAADNDVCNLLETRIQDISSATQTPVSRAALASARRGDESYDYDVFIAYHGTENPNGSLPAAKAICDFLEKNGYRVFLYGYRCNDADEDLGFDETYRAVQMSEVFLLVFNDAIPIEKRGGMLRRKNLDGRPNQLYREIKTFRDLFNDGRRKVKQFKAFYSGNTLQNDDEIYNFLYRALLDLVSGNSKVCSTKYEDLLASMQKTIG